MERLIDIRNGTLLLPTGHESRKVPAVAFGSQSALSVRSASGEPVDVLTRTLLRNGFDLALSPHLVVPALRRTPPQSRFVLRRTPAGGFEVWDPRQRRRLLHSERVSAEWNDVATAQGWVLLVGGTGVGPDIDPEGRIVLDLQELIEVQAAGRLVIGLAAPEQAWLAARPSQQSRGSLRSA